MRYIPALLALALPLAACGDSKGADDEDRAAADREVMEGTIDDSMIDLTGGETRIVSDSEAAARAEASATEEADDGSEEAGDPDDSGEG